MTHAVPCVFDRHAPSIADLCALVLEEAVPTVCCQQQEKPLVPDVLHFGDADLPGGALSFAIFHCRVLATKASMDSGPSLTCPRKCSHGSKESSRNPARSVGARS